MEISLEKLHITDAEELFVFELINKTFLKRWYQLRALTLLLEKVLDEGRIKHIKAKTTTNNIASQKVLENNGFEQEGTSNETIEMNG